MTRTAEYVRLHAPSDRDVTTPCMDLALAGVQLRPGTVLDARP
ncbi:hypothetical protein ACF05T_32240 [Streptomyces lateritius]|uniref:Uncharacterized protein n=1 Tax=Streptomyces lateritius TaxID=67313 RepID=A0ABW6YMC1_9ACTN